MTLAGRKEISRRDGEMALTMCSLWSADPPYSEHLSPMRRSNVLQPALMASAAARRAASRGEREVSGPGKRRRLESRDFWFFGFLGLRRGFRTHFWGRHCYSVISYFFIESDIFSVVCFLCFNNSNKCEGLQTHKFTAL
jgi:hypothetical protein